MLRLGFTEKDQLHITCSLGLGEKMTCSYVFALTKGDD